MTEYTATVGETLYTASTTEPHIVIAEDRTVIVPDELLEIAAQFDHNIETVTFDCPRYWDDHDFYLMEVFVNYRCADGTIGSFPCKPPVVDSEDANIIHFDWTISRNVTCAKGNISFLVCAKYSNKDGVLEHQWSSRLNQEMKVLEGFECNTEDVISENPDLIEQILMRLSDIEKNGAGGSGVVSDTFIAKYGTTTIEEIVDARKNKKLVYAVTSDGTYFPYSIGGATAIFSRTYANHTDRLVVTEAGWAKHNTDLVSTENIDSVVSRQYIDETVPSTKAVYDFVLGDPCSLEVGFNRIHVLADTISADTFYVEKGTLAGVKEQILAGKSPKIKVRSIVTDEESHAEYAFLPSGHYYNFNAGNDYIIIEFIARFGSSLKEYTMKSVGEDIELNRFTESRSANIVSGSGVNMDEFLRNCTISYGRYENTNYTCIRVFREKIDGTYQYPFVYAPYGDKISDKTPLDVARDGDWTLVINAASGNPSYGVIVQDGTIVKDTVTGQVGAIPLTIDSNGDLGYATADADLNTLINAGIVSVTTGFGVILADYESVELPTIENISHYGQTVQRQIIGQFPNGDYAIITCEGRGFADSDGWTITQARAFCQNIGLKFAYNLDGGGSTAVIVGKKQLNTIYENETGRLRSTFIVFNGTTKLSVSGGEPSEPSTPIYTITNNLTNVYTSNGTPTVLENSTYTATLAADGGYSLSDVTVVMGGVDITDAVYNNGVISIAAVTGNVVITATATAVDGYTLCEYLETDGNQYINTGIKESTLYQVEYKSVKTNWSKTGHTLSGDKIYYPFLRRNTNTSGQCILVKISSENKTIFEDENINETIAHTVKAEIDGSNLISYLDGVEVQTTPIVTVTSTRTLNLFANYSPDTAYNFIGKWYYLKMWTADGSLFRHFRPAVRDTDGVVGVYDMVTATFYENAGTGAFVVPA